MPGKAAGCDEIWPEMLKTWTEKFIGGPVCVKWLGPLEGHRKIGKLGWSSPYTRIQTGTNAIITEAFLFLVSMEKCIPTALKKDTGFCPGRSTADRTFTLQRIFEKSWKYCMPKMPTHVFGPREKLCGVFRDSVLAAACYWPTSHRSEVCFRAGGVKSQPYTKRNSAPGLSLRGHKREHSKPQSCQILNRFLFRSSPVFMNLG